MKKRVRLTESDLHKIVKRSVKKILREASKEEIDREWNKYKIKDLYNFLRSLEDGAVEDQDETLEYCMPDDKDYGVFQSYSWKDKDNYVGTLSNYIHGDDFEEWRKPIGDDDISIDFGHYKENPDSIFAYDSYHFNDYENFDDLSNDELSDFYKRFSRSAKRRTKGLMNSYYGNRNLKDRPKRFRKK